MFAPLVLDLARNIKACGISNYGAGKRGLEKAFHHLGWTYLMIFPMFGYFQNLGNKRG